MARSPSSTTLSVYLVLPVNDFSPSVLLSFQVAAVVHAAAAVDVPVHVRLCCRAVTLSLLLNSVAAFFSITGFNLEVAWLGPAAIAAAAAANCEYVQLSFSFRQLALSLSHTVFCGCCLCPLPLSRVLLHYHFRSTLITTTTKECVP